jgi:hypothetical protein
MTDWQMTPGEARALAKVVQLVRNRSGGAEWHLAGIEDALMKCRNMAAFPDLATAAIAAAREPVNRTPAIIGHEGPHWRQVLVPPSWKPPDPWSLCHECSLTEQECARKQLGSPDKHRFVSRGAYGQTLTAREAARQEAKEALAAAKRALCPHGVARTVRCALCDVEHPDPTEMRARTIDGGVQRGEPEVAP